MQPQTSSESHAKPSLAARSPEQSATPDSLHFPALPHEWAFGGFLALMTVRLAFSVGLINPCTLAFLAYTSVCVILVFWSGARPTSTRWRIRLLWYPCAMGLSYFTLAPAVHLLGVPMADARLAGWDYALLGLEPAQILAGFHLPWLTDLMVVAYLFFFYYLNFGPAYYFFNHLAQFRSCFVGLFTTYALGFLGYTLLPAGGPYLAMTKLPPLTGGAITQLMLPLVNHGSNGVDVFPSIHVAVSLYLLMFDARYYRHRFWWLLLPCIALWVSTVYLRYHYVVDVLGGALIAVVGIVTASLYRRSALAQAADTADHCSVPGTVT
ncbi:MAG: phosphatase PAP2 family protein [Stenotrophobium sp.]